MEPFLLATPLLLFWLPFDDGSKGMKVVNPNGSSLVQIPMT